MNAAREGRVGPQSRGLGCPSQDRPPGGREDQPHLGSELQGAAPTCHSKLREPDLLSAPDGAPWPPGGAPCPFPLKVLPAYCVPATLCLAHSRHSEKTIELWIPNS